MSEIDPRVQEGLEALAHLLSVSDKKKSGEETVDHLVEEIGSLRSIYESTKEDLMGLHGLGRVSAEVIDLVDDLARCAMRDMTRRLSICALSCSAARSNTVI